MEDDSNKHFKRSIKSKLDNIFDWVVLSGDVVAHARKKSYAVISSSASPSHSIDSDDNNDLSLSEQTRHPALPALLPTTSVQFAAAITSQG